MQYVNCCFGLQIQLANYSVARQDTNIHVGDTEEVEIKREEERVAFEL